MLTTCAEFELATQGSTDIHDVTDEVSRIVSQFGLQEGLATVFTPGATASVTAIEFESGAISDLREAIRRLAPEGEHYAHDARWGDGNGFSHVRSALLGPSLAVPVSNGRLALGTWQQIVVACHDNHPRTRRVIVQLLGTAA